MRNNLRECKQRNFTSQVSRLEAATSTFTQLNLRDRVDEESQELERQSHARQNEQLRLECCVERNKITQTWPGQGVGELWRISDETKSRKHRSLQVPGCHSDRGAVRPALKLWTCAKLAAEFNSV